MEFIQHIKNLCMFLWPLQNTERNVPSSYFLKRKNFEKSEFAKNAILSPTFKEEEWTWCDLERGFAVRRLAASILLGKGRM